MRYQLRIQEFIYNFYLQGVQDISVALSQIMYLRFYLSRSTTKIPIIHTVAVPRELLGNPPPHICENMVNIYFLEID